MQSANNRSFYGVPETYEEWRNLTPEQRDHAMFCAINAVIDVSICLKKDQTKRTWITNAWAFAGGVLGGLIAVLTTKLGGI